MTEQIKREETAFPYAEVDGYGGIIIQHLGLTIRDYFAAKAMQGILSASVDVVGHGLSFDQNYLCKESYNFADAMLKAREL